MFRIVCELKRCKNEEDVLLCADNDQRHSAADERALPEEHDTTWGEHGADDETEGINRAVWVTWTGQLTVTSV